MKGVQESDRTADEERRSRGELSDLFTFQCTRCRKKPAIVTRGRKVFLCGDCATGSLWYDMVGALVDDNGSPAATESVIQDQVEVSSGDHDPWEDS